MSDILATAISGLNAAQTQFTVSAYNVANAYSTSTRSVDGTVSQTPFMPVDVVQISQKPNGVYTATKASGKASVLQFDPGHPDADERGNVAYPDVDPIAEYAKQREALVNFRANLSMIETYKDTLGTLIDAIG